MSIIRTGLPILVELINLVNSVIIFLSQMTLLRWLTFLLGSQTVILIVLLFWIYLFLLMLVFVLQWLFLHWEILIMALSQFPLTFHHTHNGIRTRGSFLNLKCPFRKTNAGQMALSHIGPTIWSKTPDTLKRTKNLNTFKHNLKEHYLKELKNSNFC